MALMCAVMASSSACTQALEVHDVVHPNEDQIWERVIVEIPEPYAGVNDKKGPHYIRTRDGRILEAVRFKVTETGFSIYTAKKLSYYRPQKFDPPLEIAFEDVASVSRWERRSRAKTRDQKRADLVMELHFAAVLIFANSFARFPSVP